MSGVRIASAYAVLLITSYFSQSKGTATCSAIESKHTPAGHEWPRITPLLTFTRQVSSEQEPTWWLRVIIPVIKDDVERYANRTAMQFG